MSLSKSCEESDLPILKCKQCGKHLLNPKDTYKFREKRVINGQVMIAHWYSCRECAFELVTPLCEDIDNDCPIGKPGNPHERAIHMKYDGGRGETYCKKCGLVQEEVSISAMGGVENDHFIKQNKPGDYDPLIKKLLDDPLINSFNYLKDSHLIIRCKKENEYSLYSTYPDSKLVFI